MHKAIAAILFGAIALSGCAADLRYAKTDGLGSSEDMQRALAGCKVQGAMAPGEGAWGALAAANIIDNCMRAQGWIRTP